MFLIRHGQSEFNRAMNQHGRDPGIHDAPLTDLGFKQATKAAEHLAKAGIRRVMSSPYTRALQTASVIAEHLGLHISIIEPLAGERAVYSCDVGTPTSILRSQWAGHDFAHVVEEKWWPEIDETHPALVRRVDKFKSKWQGLLHADDVLLVSHWYFLNTLTQYDFKNGEVIKLMPTRITA